MWMSEPSEYATSQSPCLLTRPNTSRGRGHAPFCVLLKNLTNRQINGGFYGTDLGVIRSIATGTQRTSSSHDMKFEWRRSLHWDAFTDVTESVPSTRVNQIVTPTPGKASLNETDISRRRKGRHRTRVTRPPSQGSGAPRHDGGDTCLLEGNRSPFF